MPARRPICNTAGMAVANAPTVLLVDDHAGFRSTLRNLLESVARVREAASGEEAIQLYAATPTDWVVMDLRMPGMGGLKATEAIRQMDPQARILVISQFNEPELAERARQAGAAGFLNKEELPRLLEFIRSSTSPTA